jgi:glycosyltransferase involved in cell wall biosynthesis
VEFIPNSVDLTDMQIVDRKEARIKLGLDPNRKYLCFGVNSFTDNYKGFDLLIEILKRIEFDCDLLLFGGTINSDRILFNGKIVDLGYTSSKSKLCEIFSASDLFLMPSIMETFGKTVVESLACGTPVVAWSSTGPASILNSLCPELIAKAGDIESFKDIIINVLSENLELDRFSCRSKALEFSNYNVALDYIGFYQRILKLH